MSIKKFHSLWEFGIDFLLITGFPSSRAVYEIDHIENYDDSKGVMGLVLTTHLTSPPDQRAY